MHALTTFMSTHHRYCDELFAQAEQAANSRDWPQCAALSTQYVNAMETHFNAEETVLFPAFEQATGNTMGPTRIMRMEHEQMRELFEQMRSAAEAADQTTFLGVTETLLVLMEQHNMKEENILYPMCDQHLNSPELPRQLESLLGHPAGTLSG